MKGIHVQQLARARIPTEYAEYQLCYYQNSLDDKEHLALILGDLDAERAPLVRIHSECFTGDVLGSLRCDCGHQLQEALREIAARGCGLLIYLRQEGRGIGLLDKLRAYNLQDEGLDTVDANLKLGHQVDARDYTIAACILEDLGQKRLRLLTNNPEKVEALKWLGIEVVERIGLTAVVQKENAAYLATKVKRMRHFLNLESRELRSDFGQALSHALIPGRRNGRPFVTLSYAQGIDGAITRQSGTTLALSGAAALRMTHQLRANHDAILIGRKTAVADDPLLTVRLAKGPHPQPIVLDSQLRLPLSLRLFHAHPQLLWVATTSEAAPAQAEIMSEKGVRLIPVITNGDGRVSLPALLQELARLQVDNLMVEGGAAVITNFLQERLVDRLIITIAPKILGGLPGVGQLPEEVQPMLTGMQVQQLGDDLIIFGDVQF